MTKLKVVEPAPSTPLKSLAGDWLGSVRAGAACGRWRRTAGPRIALPAVLRRPGHRAAGPARPARVGPLHDVAAGQVAGGRQAAQQGVGGQLLAIGTTGDGS